MSIQPLYEFEVLRLAELYTDSVPDMTFCYELLQQALAVEKVIRDNEEELIRMQTLLNTLNNEATTFSIEAQKISVQQRMTEIVELLVKEKVKLRNMVSLLNR
jgi:type III secretory pathway component EscV